ncbi:MAG: hypothetical protein JWR70_245 [Modestobacter sp.]|jgi:hypothetical protein|nr:hypothetical protein [Modestobacter sp.]
MSGLGLLIRGRSRALAREQRSVLRRSARSQASSMTPGSLQRPPGLHSRWWAQRGHDRASWGRRLANRCGRQRASEVQKRTGPVTADHRWHQARPTHNPWVVGSSPTCPTGITAGQRGVCLSSSGVTLPRVRKVSARARTAASSSDPRRRPNGRRGAPSRRRASSLQRRARAVAEPPSRWLRTTPRGWRLCAGARAASGPVVPRRGPRGRVPALGTRRAGRLRRRRS